MFEQLMKRSDWIWTYKMGRFAPERRAFLCHLNEEGHSLRTLQNINKLLLAVAEHVNVRKAGDHGSTDLAGGQELGHEIMCTEF